MHECVCVCVWHWHAVAFVVVFISFIVVFYFGFSLLRGFFLNCIFDSGMCAHVLYILRRHAYVCVYVCVCMLGQIPKLPRYDRKQDRLDSILDCCRCCCCWLILSFLLAWPGQTCLCLSVSHSVSQSSSLSTKLSILRFLFACHIAFHSVDFVAALLVLDHCRRRRRRRCHCDLLIMYVCLVVGGDGSRGGG